MRIYLDKHGHIIFTIGVDKSGKTDYSTMRFVKPMQCIEMIEGVDFTVTPVDMKSQGKALVISGKNKGDNHSHK